MEKLLIILLIAGIPANVFLLIANMKGAFMIKLFWKGAAFIYMVFAVVITLKYYNLI